MLATLAQIEGAGDVLRKATDSGWMAGAICLLLIVFMGALAWLVRHWIQEAAAREQIQAASGITRENAIRSESMEREQRMAKRIDQLEDFQNTTLINLVAQTHECLEKTTSAIAGLAEAVRSMHCPVMQVPNTP
jgi:hypothetical protein